MAKGSNKALMKALPQWRGRLLVLLLATLLSWEFASGSYDFTSKLLFENSELEEILETREVKSDDKQGFNWDHPDVHIIHQAPVEYRYAYDSFTHQHASLPLPISSKVGHYILYCSLRIAS